jgi:hypothetical protein
VNGSVPLNRRFSCGREGRYPSGRVSTDKVEPCTPTIAPWVPMQLGTLEQILGYELPLKRSKARLRLTEHPNGLRTSCRCPGQRKDVVSRVCFTSARPVRFRSWMRLFKLCHPGRSRGRLPATSHLLGTYQRTNWIPGPGESPPR